MTRIKICGLMRMQDIQAVNEALPDYIGFVFAASRRRITHEKAGEMKACLDPGIKTVGVFVNEDIENIVKLCNSHVIDMVQLHGDEDEGYIRKLKDRIPNKIIKAVRVRNAGDIERATELSCDYLLLDAYNERMYGGSGETFDWAVIPKIEKPFFLAGGINAGNVLQAIERYRPYCIDVSSGVETGGYKDACKIMDIVSRIRGGR